MTRSGHPDATTAPSTGTAGASITVAALVAERLAAAGVSDLFGMPGGGSSVELIDAWVGSGRHFVLAHTETGGALMASAQAEVGERLGACLATLGPGAASIMNGVAHAQLDRVPLLVLTERHPDSVAAIASHQTIDQRAMFGAVTKSSRPLTARGAAEELDVAIARALDGPPGPVHLDWPPDVATASIVSKATPGRPLVNADSIEGPVDRVLRRSRRPLLLVGLAARRDRDALAIRALCEKLGIPALLTYKAKGVLPDDHKWMAGVLTHGALERSVVESADVLIGVGLDPVELLPRPWSYAQPFVSCMPWRLTQQQLPIAAAVTGDISTALLMLEAHLPSQTDWDVDAVAGLVAAQRDALRAASSSTLGPNDVIDAALEVFGSDRSLCIDAGAHMFAAMGLWPATRPRQLVISNGLSTMGFSLPAAIGIELLHPGSRTVALIGDGGLLMCLGELRTASAERLPIRVVVFDDGALSLIRIKQLARGLEPHATGITGIDWAGVARGLGVATFTASNRLGLERALRDADVVDGPALVAVRVDPDPYRRLIAALRG